MRKNSRVDQQHYWLRCLDPHPGSWLDTAEFSFDFSGPICHQKLKVQGCTELALTPLAAAIGRNGPTSHSSTLERGFYITPGQYNRALPVHRGMVEMTWRAWEWRSMLCPSGIQCRGIDEGKMSSFPHLLPLAADRGPDATPQQL